MREALGSIPAPKKKRQKKKKTSPPKKCRIVDVEIVTLGCSPVFLFDMPDLKEVIDS
jgi:hypothetical protein